MGNGISKVFFDQRDYELLGIVNDVLDRNKSFGYLKNLLYPHMHPRGIKEMAASQGLRMAYAAVHLLESLEVGKAADRLTALRSLRDEVMHSGDGPMQKNTARVLLVIMKELVRTRDDKLRQLQLAHDFRVAASGKPRMIRALLRRYHLLEMPEEWNQIAFDEHIHDVNTKGRKSPSHLVMDAWIKGIRQLTVVYYNHVRSQAAEELLEASEIMGITVRVGVELSARLYDRFVQLIWTPRGFTESRDFLSFLGDPAIQSFMDEGIKVSEYQEQYVLGVLREFNRRHRLEINKIFELDLAPLDQAEFLAFVGAGQTSILHLAQFVHAHLLPAMRSRVAGLKERLKEVEFEERTQVARVIDEIKNFDSEQIVERYLRPAQNPDVPNPHVPPADDAGLPELLKLGPSQLIDRLNQLHSGYRLTLNLSNLKAEDVLELLFDCKGAISHLEIFNLKDYAAGKAPNYNEINELQQNINDGNVIALKKNIRGIILRMEASEGADVQERISRLKEIQHDIATLQGYYKKAPLKSRIGTDSTGRSRRHHGMGLAIKDTLPRRAQRELDRVFDSSRLTIPVSIETYLQVTHIPQEDIGSAAGRLYRLLGHIPGVRLLSRKYRKDWLAQDSSARIVSQGNIVTLGGVHDENGSGLDLPDPHVKEAKKRVSWKYLNSFFKNSLKVTIGLIPAFTTFFLTKEWWLLRYLGAFIWFGITGLRNILQSVLGAGGIRRSPLLKWDSYVSWSRLSDSLLYTGFSVPLLDYLVKTVILDRTFDINTETSPALLYTFIALANGCYISSHNIWRGLPKGAIVGNLFRSLLSIPLAITLSALIGHVLATGFGVVGVAAILENWAAIISKASSDCVAGVIEGMADRHNNIRNRLRDYTTKLAQLFATYAQLDLLFPEADLLKMLDSPKSFMRKIGAEARDLEKIIIINALDLLYFWMYQPRARSVLCSILGTMSNEERQILVHSQSVLRRKREVSQLFVNGLVGKKFSQALSFYLDRSDEYLDAIEKIAYYQCRTEMLLWWPTRVRKYCQGALLSLKNWSVEKAHR
jgi:hypothetical protein